MKKNWLKKKNKSLKCIKSFSKKRKITRKWHQSCLKKAQRLQLYRLLILIKLKVQPKFLLWEALDPKWLNHLFIKLMRTNKLLFVIARIKLLKFKVMKLNLCFHWWWVLFRAWSHCIIKLKKVHKILFKRRIIWTYFRSKLKVF